MIFQLKKKKLQKLRDLGRNILNVGLLCNRGKCTKNAVFL